MRNTVIAILLFFGLSAEKCNQPPQHLVALTLTQTEAYCGGAMPPPELIKDLATPKPYTGAKVYVYGDGLICLDSISATDTNYENRLNTGHYTIRLVSKLEDLETIQGEEQRCLTAFNQRILSMFDVLGDTTLIANLYFGCNPCLPPPP
ncbi:MAG: hypothetical protein KC517_04085 [Bacteroidetes bacterium]|jgi:hypothetical protein|nr:hypothetical protein [Bacteroidota bacterium]